MKIKLTAEMRMRLAYAEELDITDIVAPIIAERDALADEVEALKDWRRLALQFDGHRMQAMSMLKMVASAEFDIEEVKKFIAAAPVCGDKHLRDVRAEAGRAGWAACVDWLVENSSADLFTDGEAEQAREIGDQYAERVKDGEE